MGLSSPPRVYRRRHTNSRLGVCTGPRHQISRPLRSGLSTCKREHANPRSCTTASASCHSRSAQPVNSAPFRRIGLGLRLRGLLARNHVRWPINGVSLRFPATPYLVEFWTLLASYTVQIPKLAFSLTKF